MNRHDEPERISKNVIGLTARFDKSVEYKPIDKYRNNVYNYINNYEVDDLLTYNKLTYNTTIFNNNNDDCFIHIYLMKNHKYDENLRKINVLQNTNNECYNIQDI